MTRLLHLADQPWVDLTTPLLDATRSGQIVLWTSLSGTMQLFAIVDGCLTRRRRPARGSEHPGDGWPLIVDPPFFATACGCGDGSGYRSTRPLLVAVLDDPADVTDLIDLGHQLLRKLIADNFDPNTLPEGHPPEPCGALYCARITPALITHP